MFNIFRFSKNGFAPQHQSHMFDNFNYKINKNDFDKFNDYQKRLILSSMSEEIDQDFNFYGVFAFLVKPSFEDYKYFLNHLNDKPDFHEDFHTMEILENHICYIDDGRPYKKRNKTNIKNAFLNGHNTIYIPFNKKTNNYDII